MSRFAAAYNANAGNYGRVGKQVADEAARIFDATRSNAPDYEGIARKGMRAKTEERIAKEAAKAGVAQAGMNAVARNRINNIKTESDLIRTKSNIKQKMAGKLAATVGLMAKGITDKRDRPLPPAQTSLDAIKDLWRDTYGTEFGEATPVPTFGTPTPEVDTPEAVTPEAVTPEATQPTLETEVPTQPSTTIPTAITPDANGFISQGQMKELGLAHGLSDQEATTFAAIGMGESGGKAGTDTVQSGLDPGKKNEFSVGLWQVNTQAHQDKLDRRGWTIDDLRDPNKNAEIAVEIYRERGSFEPWGAFTNGSYQDFL